MGELETRLRDNPNIDLKLLQRLEATIVELEKRVEALKQPQAESEKPAEVNITIAGSKVESSAESEGKKWAKIIREKYFGGLYGHFSNKWGFYLPDRSFRTVIDSSGGNVTTALFGIKNEQHKEYFFRGVHGLEKDAMHQYGMQPQSPVNFLTVNRLNPWIMFSYYSWLDPRIAPDSRGYYVPLKFTFCLNSEEANKFTSALIKNIDLIEDVFQNVYPGLTGGEKEAQRIIVDKLVIVNETSPKPVKKTFSFSHPVGETTFVPRSR